MTLSFDTPKYHVFPKPEDIMITKPCSGCDADVLLRKDNDLCMSCIETKGLNKSN